jgi:hypothetical protein
MAMKTDNELLDLARSVVPDHLKALGVIARRDAPAIALKRSALIADQPIEDLAAAVAREVGAHVAQDEPDSADVEFVEHTPIGARSTVVQIRGGKVARVLKRG